MTEIVSRNGEETRALAATFVESIKTVPGPLVVELVGDLGAGKTTFVKGVAARLGITEEITSPTFLIQRNYTIPAGFPWERLIHIDAYRIEKPEELEAIRFHEYASDPKNIVFIEWPANLGTDLPGARRITFTHGHENERIINF